MNIIMLVKDLVGHVQGELASSQAERRQDRFQAVKIIGVIRERLEKWC